MKRSRRAARKLAQRRRTTQNNPYMLSALIGVCLLAVCFCVHLLGPKAQPAALIQPPSSTTALPLTYEGSYASPNVKLIGTFSPQIQAESFLQEIDRVSVANQAHHVSLTLNKGACSFSGQLSDSTHLSGLLASLRALPGLAIVGQPVTSRQPNGMLIFQISFHYQGTD